MSEAIVNYFRFPVAIARKFLGFPITLARADAELILFRLPNEYSHFQFTKEQELMHKITDLHSHSPF